MRREAGEDAARTAWHLFDVPTMWTLVENQRTDNHWKLVNGWRMAYELTSTHLTRLKTYRDNLATAWPPDRSPASAAYCGRLDYLIQHVQQAHDVAVANFTTLSVVTTAIAGARAELKKIYDEYQATRQTMAPHERRFKDPKAPAPPNLDFQNLPGTRRDIEELNARARTLMSSLADTLAEASIQIKQPPPYTPRGTIDSSEPYGEDNRVTSRQIPPIVPLQLSQTGPVPQLSGQANSSQQPATLGPILGGASTLPTLPPSTTIPQSPATSPTNVTTVPPTPAHTITTTPSARSGATDSTSRPPPANHNAFRTGGLGTNGTTPRPAPAGGLIGGIPPSIGTTGISTQPRQRVNPVGGVIGNRGSLLLQTQSSRHGSSGTLPPTTQPSTRDSKWDPDNPWEVQHGTRPVVLPSSDPVRTDPGPVIGQNR
ncbi:hypothetical protein [Polymorphospora rubra]|uniref:Uncharacterized protein n=1 Tax=Polymorphospora rubra TaxID=338584 RepID=A0A810N2G6_9ACTN|nr:hypothetical protein [Polymorphospora rubra]BCJ66389.1 hypothetical protein Prubr_34100 [Polymorphospora rubra]